MSKRADRNRQRRYERKTARGKADADRAMADMARMEADMEATSRIALSSVFRAWSGTVTGRKE